VIVTIITPTIRPAGALRAAESVQAAREHAPDLDVRHVIAYWPGEGDDARSRLGGWLTDLIACTPGWLIFLDDDNLLHPRLLARLSDLTRDYPHVWAFLFGMEYPAFGGGVLSPQLPPHVGYIDGGQVVIRSDYANSVEWPNGNAGDGRYLAELYARAPERWLCVDEVLTAHNAQERR
jgi:hypothetical protein